MNSAVKVLVLTGYGLNCDNETAHTFELAGANPHKVHINDLIGGEVNMADYRIIVFGGGFGWGDDHGGGVVQAARFKTHLGDELLDFISSDRLIIGICNGFQALANLGLLPATGGDYTSRKIALTANACGNFRDQWVYMNVDSESPCVFTKGMDKIELPVRHGEGNFVTDGETLKALEKNNQITLRYTMPDGKSAEGVFPYNPNGSMADIAGICDPTGKIFGLMPHPEAFHHPTNHPDWTRRKALSRKTGVNEHFAVDGLEIFKNAVSYFK